MIGLGRYLFGTIPTATGNTGSLAMTADSAVLAATATSEISGSLAQTAAESTLAATGTVANSGTLTMTAGDSTLVGTGTVAVVGSLSMQLGDATLSATGTVGVDGTLTVTAGDSELVATGTVAISGQLSVTADAATLDAAGVAGEPETEPEVVRPPVVIHVNPYGKTYEPPPRRGAPREKRRVVRRDELEVDASLRVSSRPFIRVEQRERVRFGEPVTDTVVELVSLVTCLQLATNLAPVVLPVVAFNLPTVSYKVASSADERVQELEREVYLLKKSKRRADTDAFSLLLELLEH